MFSFSLWAYRLSFSRDGRLVPEAFWKRQKLKRDLGGSLKVKGAAKDYYLNIVISFYSLLAFELVLRYGMLVI